MGKEIVAEHDDGDVHQIIGDQDGGQRSLRVFTKCLNLLVSLILLLIQFIEIIG